MNANVRQYAILALCLTVTACSNGPSTIGPTDGSIPTDGATRVDAVGVPVDLVTCYALQLDGVNALMLAPAIDAYNPSGAFTAEAWVYPSVNNRGVVIAHWGDTRLGTASWDIEVNSAGHVVFYLSTLGGSVDNALISSSMITLNQWSHIAAVFDPENHQARLYMNGVPAGMSIVSYGTVFVSSGVPLTIGDYDYPTYTLTNAPFTGYINEVRVSTVARYSAPFVPVTALASDASTIALYELSSPSGTTATDSSPSTNSGMLENNARLATAPCH